MCQDTDGSEELSLDELMSVLRAMGQNPTPQETLDLMKEAPPPPSYPFGTQVTLLSTGGHGWRWIDGLRRGMGALFGTSTPPSDYFGCFTLQFNALMAMKLKNCTPADEIRTALEAAPM